MTTRPNLAEQIRAIENVIASQRGWMETRASALAKKGITEDYGLQCTRMWFPAVEAALDSLRFLQRNEAAIRAAIKGGSHADAVAADPA